MRCEKEKHITWLQFLLGPNVSTSTERPETVPPALCRRSCDGRYTQAEAGSFFVSICGEAESEGNSQQSQRLCQAPSAKSTWPGPSAAPPELYHQRGADCEKG